MHYIKGAVYVNVFELDMLRWESIGCEVCMNCGIVGLFGGRIHGHFGVGLGVASTSFTRLSVPTGCLYLEGVCLSLLMSTRVLTLLKSPRERSLPLLIECSIPNCFR